MNNINMFISFRYLINWKFPHSFFVWAEESYLDSLFDCTSYVDCTSNYYNLCQMTPFYLRDLKALKRKVNIGSTVETTKLKARFKRCMVNPRT